MTLKLNHRKIIRVVGATLIAIFAFSLFVTLPVLHFAVLGRLTVNPVAMNAALVLPVIASLALFPFMYYAGWVNDRLSALQKAASDEAMQEMMRKAIRDAIRDRLAE